MKRAGAYFGASSVRTSKYSGALFGESFANGLSLLGKPEKRLVEYSPHEGLGKSGMEGAASTKSDWSCSLSLFCSASSVVISNACRSASASLLPKRCQFLAEA